MNNGNNTNGMTGFVGARELQETFLPLLLRTYAQRGYAVRLVTLKVGKEDILKTSPLTGKVEQLTLENLVVAPETTERLEHGHEYLARDLALPYAAVAKVFADFQGFMRPDHSLNIVVVEFRGLKFDASRFKVFETQNEGNLVDVGMGFPNENF